MAILGFRRKQLNNSIAKSALRIVAPAIPFEYLAGITSKELFPVKIGGASFSYEFSGDDSIGEKLYWHGQKFFEPEAISAFVHYLRDARTVLDIGANTGLYSLLTLASNPTCRVVAWEPFPATYQKLVRNIALNGLQTRAELRCEAATDTDSVCFLEPNENWTMHTVSAAPSASSIAVQSKTVDSAILAGEAVDLIKIDVEGHEYEVLRGARRVLAESRPTILIEIQPDCPTRHLTMALFDAMGYTIQPLDAHANWLAAPNTHPA